MAGNTAGPGADVYSLGAALFAALRGEPPFTARDAEPPVGFAMRIMSEQPPDLRRAGVPEALAVVVERAMAKDPADRYPSAAALRDALQSIDLANGAGIGPPTDATVAVPLPGPAPRPTPPPTPVPIRDPGRHLVGSGPFPTRPCLMRV